MCTVTDSGDVCSSRLVPAGELQYEPLAVDHICSGQMDKTPRQEQAVSVSPLRTPTSVLIVQSHSTFLFNPLVRLRPDSALPLPETR